MAFYPLYMDIEGKRCVVIGGGEVAERKVASLVECGADVEVISPNLTQNLRELVKAGAIEVKQRSYEPGDIESAILVIAATDDNIMNRAIHREAVENNIPVNVVDVPELCTFIVPSTIRRGDLIISISTSGSCPALAKKIRKQLQQLFGDEYANYCAVLRDFRKEVAGRYAEPEERKRAIHRLIDSDVIELIKEGRTREVEERVRACI